MRGVATDDAPERDHGVDLTGAGEHLRTERDLERPGHGQLDDVCRVDVFVRNIEHFERIHKVRKEYFGAPPPASTMVEVTKMVSPDYLIEINAIAVVPAR